MILIKMDNFPSMPMIPPNSRIDAIPMFQLKEKRTKGCDLFWIDKTQGISMGDRESHSVKSFHYL